MDNKKKYSKYYEVLEIEDTATLSDIRRAYLHLRELYSSESLVTDSFEGEFSEEKEDILTQIEEAYHQLLLLLAEKGKKEERRTTPSPANTVDKENFAFNGTTLKKIRERRGIGLHDLAMATKISHQVLQSIEKDEYHKLPPGGYLRWHIQTFAKQLSIDPSRTAEEYMRRYQQWKTKKS